MFLAFYFETINLYSLFCLSYELSRLCPLVHLQWGGTPINLYGRADLASINLITAKSSFCDCRKPVPQPMANTTEAKTSIAVEGRP